MKAENLKYFWGPRKNLSFRGEVGGFTKNQYVGGIAKKGGLTQFADLRGTWQERGGWSFDRGDTPMHTMS